MGWGGWYECTICTTVNLALHIRIQSCGLSVVVILLQTIWLEVAVLKAQCNFDKRKQSLSHIVEKCIYIFW